MSTFIASRRTSSTVTSSPLIGPCRDFGADAGAGGAIGLAVALVLHLDLLIRGHAVHVEQTETQALHTVRAARVVNHGEPGLPRRGTDWRRLRLAFNRRRKRLRVNRLLCREPAIGATRDLQPLLEKEL